jgi:hypothetical protein
MNVCVGYFETDLLEPRGSRLYDIAKRRAVPHSQLTAPGPWRLSTQHDGCVAGGLELLALTH